jgi:hypothetical protein
LTLPFLESVLTRANCPSDSYACPPSPSFPSRTSPTRARNRRRHLPTSTTSSLLFPLPNLSLRRTTSRLCVEAVQLQDRSNLPPLNRSSQSLSRPEDKRTAEEVEGRWRCSSRAIEQGWRTAQSRWSSNRSSSTSPSLSSHLLSNNIPFRQTPFPRLLWSGSIPPSRPPPLRVRTRTPDLPTRNVLPPTEPTRPSPLSPLLSHLNRRLLPPRKRRR